ncbi:MAG: DUF6069 family protein [Propionicimonas sp.]
MNSKLATRQVWARGTVGAGVAAALNVLVAALSARLVNASPAFLALQPGPVITVTLVTVLAGTAVFAILNRFLTHPRTVFAVVASVVAVASLIAPIALSTDTSGVIAGVSPAAALALIPLHLIPAAVIIGAFGWRRRVVTA